MPHTSRWFRTGGGEISAPSSRLPTEPARRVTPNNPLPMTRLLPFRIRMMRTPLVLSLLVALALQAATAAANWPSWRGPLNQGISSEQGLPTHWSSTDRLWRVELPGAAGATPVVWEDHIFLTTVDGEDLVLMCFTTDGNVKWRRALGRGNQDVRGDEGNSAAPSPVTDGQH